MSASCWKWLGCAISFCFGFSTHRYCQMVQLFMSLQLQPSPLQLSSQAEDSRNSCP